MFSKDLPVRFDCLYSPAASQRLTGLADLESNKALWGRLTCDAPLSAKAIGFISLTGTKILAVVRKTLLPHAAGVTLKCVSPVHG